MTTSELVYKILLPDEWESFDASGRFDGSPLDKESGFVHCSSRAQVATTASRYFTSEPALVVVAVDALRIGDALRWEAATDGELFPHVYGPIPRSAVVAVHAVAGAAGIDEADL